MDPVAALDCPAGFLRPEKTGLDWDDQDASWNVHMTVVATRLVCVGETNYNEKADEIVWLRA